MQFSDTSNLTGLIQDCEAKTLLGNAAISGNTTLLKDFTRWINEGYGKIMDIIMRADGRFQFDDPNHSDTPIKTFNITANTKEVTGILSSAPTAAADWLEIERVECCDENGTFYLLEEIDIQDITSEAMSEFEKASSIPRYYDLTGSLLRLYPAPSYSYTNGLKIYYKREPDYFAYTDTTQRPGFATKFHHYLSDYATFKWNGIRKNDYSLAPILKETELEVGQFYARRDKSERKKLTRLKQYYK